MQNVLSTATHCVLWLKMNRHVLRRCRDLPSIKGTVMKNCLVTGTMAIFACCALIGLAQEGTKPAAKPAQAEQEKGRLPANYGKLGLTEAQKNSIYEVQKKYKSQLDDLEKQLDALKSKRDGEIEMVLSDAQRKILKDLVDAAKEAKKPKKGAEVDKEGAEKAPEPKK